MRGMVTRSANGRRCAARIGRGFSLIDLLVSVSVMVILMAILMPALRMAHERARQIKCASNIRQMAIALETYTDDYQEYLPPARFDEEPPTTAYGRGAQGQAIPNQNQDVDNADGTDTMFVRYRSTSPFSNEPLWDGLGILFGDDYLNHFGVFYCPSHHGDHQYTSYANEWTNGTGSIAANYQYRIPAGIKRLGDLERRTTIVADGMRTRDDYNHIIGNNYMKADLSIGWFADHEGRVLAALPERPRTGIQQPSEQNPWSPIDDAN